MLARRSGKINLNCRGSALVRLVMTGKFGQVWLLRPTTSVLRCRWAEESLKYSQADYGRNFALTEDIIQSCASYSRNARLAMLKLYASGPTKGVDHRAKLLSACLKYFRDYSTKLICFHDLRPYIERLNNQQQLDFLKLSAGEARNLKPTPREPEVRRRRELSLLAIADI